jgi:hypothetical protein
MNYQEFKRRIQGYPVFSSSHLTAFPGKLQVLRNQLKEWCQKGWLVKLRRGIYVLNRDDRRINPSRVFIASQLLSPSYISTQYALARYGIIPERVADVTSITTRKTSVFINEFGKFVYQHLKSACFAGFKEEKDENGFSYFIAEPEKALVDFFYLNLSAFPERELSIFDESYRIKKEFEFKRKKIIYYARLFKNKKLLRIADNFCQYLRG